VLAGKEAGQQPARTFVRSSYETIQCTMLPSNSSFGILSAPQTSTNMDKPPLPSDVLPFTSGHGPYLPSGSLPKEQGYIIIVSPIAEIIIGQ
jgi:hypothetical protein